MGSQAFMVSVVIPYYNSERTIERALDSVCGQSFEELVEIILVNDGSTDQSRDVVHRFIQDHPGFIFRHVDQANGGPSKARNAGMRLSSGKYIAFLDSDDTWEPDKLSVQVRYMEEHPDVAISGTDYYINSNEVTKYGSRDEIVEADFKSMLFKVFFSMPTVIVRRDVIERERLHYLEGKHYGEDLLFYLQIVRNHRGVRISRPLAKLHKFLYGQGGLTRDLNKLLVHELDNARILYRQNAGQRVKIGFWLYRGLLIYSVLKHYVRMYKSRKYRKIVQEGQP